MPQTPNLVWLRSFECAARHLSFTAAAAELGMTQTALSLHVRSLEAELECQLFTRVARTLTLTEVGQAYAYSLRRALGDITLSTAGLFGHNTSQALTVRVPISTATLCLAHRLPEFVRDHPGIPIRLISNIWAESAGRGNVDVELRLGIGEWTDAISKKISRESIVPIMAASPDRPSVTIETVRHGPLIKILGFDDMWHRYLSAQNLPPIDDVLPYTVDTTVAAVDIVAAGGGCAVVLERFARTAIDAGRPIAIVGRPAAIEQSHYLIEGSGSERNSAAKQLFEAWLRKVFE